MRCFLVETILYTRPNKKITCTSKKLAVKAAVMGLLNVNVMCLVVAFATSGTQLSN